MLECFGQSTIYGLLLIILPLFYIVRKLFKVRKQKLLKEHKMKIEAAVQAPDTPPKKLIDDCSKKIDVDVDEMRSAVDLINFQLILIESKIYKDIEPVPPLSMGEFTEAVRHLDYIKTNTLPFAIGEIMKDCK